MTRRGGQHRALVGVANESRMSGHVQVCRTPVGRRQACRDVASVREAPRHEIAGR